MATLDPQDEFDDILHLNAKECYISLCLASFPKDSVVPHFEQLDISKGDLTEAFQTAINYNLAERKADNDRKPAKYRFDGPSAAYEVEYIRLSEEPNDIIKRQIEKVLTSPLGIPIFEQDDAFLELVRFYVIVAQPKNAPDVAHQVCFYRSYTQMRKLGRSIIALFTDKGYYDRIEPEKAFLFDNEIDCVSRGDFMFIFNRNRFHRMFEFPDRLKKEVDKSITLLKPHIPINDFDQFSEACKNDARKVTKLRSIVNKPYLASLKGSMDRIVAFNKKHNLGLNIENNMFIYESKTLWRLLKLLDDDFLFSELTERHYEANSKRDL